MKTLKLLLLYLLTFVSRDQLARTLQIVLVYLLIFSSIYAIGITLYPDSSSENEYSDSR